MYEFKQCPNMENIMTNDSVSNKEAAEKTSNENKIIFAPLGKYAAISVLMVTFIVATAVTL